MNNYSKLKHTTWECKYHVVFIPKYRKKVLYGAIKKHIGNILHELASYRQCVIEEGHVCADHIHMMISIPPKHSVSSVIGYIKGKSAISIARKFVGRKQNYSGQGFWARGYFVTTVGRDEETIRAYIKHQDENDMNGDQPDLF